MPAPYFGTGESEITLRKSESPETAPINVSVAHSPEGPVTNEPITLYLQHLVDPFTESGWEITYWHDAVLVGSRLSGTAFLDSGRQLYLSTREPIASPSEGYPLELPLDPGTYRIRARLHRPADGQTFFTLEHEFEVGDIVYGEGPVIHSFLLEALDTDTLQVSFISTEQLTNITVAIEGDLQTHLVESQFTETGIGPWTYRAQFSGSDAGGYTATLITAEDEEGQDGAMGQTSSLGDPTPLRGLHYTDAELAIWRDRVVNGPYTDDWTRIVGNKDSFMADPSAELWPGYPDTECVPQGNTSPPSSFLGFELRDAAFYSLVMEDDAVRAQVLATLTEQTEVAGADFTQSPPWCLDDNRLYDVAPSFMIAEWAMRVLYAYDYIRPFLTPAEKEPIEQWLSDAAYYFRINSDDSLISDNYSDWENGVLSTRGQNNANNCDTDYAGDMGQTYLGGPKVCTLGKYYNNRRAHMTAFYVLAGIVLEEETPQIWGKRWVKEYVKYHIYPDTSLNELHRSHNKNAALGWSYSFQTYDKVMSIVDAFARKGDTELYEYTTSDGTPSSAGGPKTIKFPADFFRATSEGDWLVYNYGTSESVENLIDGVWYPDNYYSYEVWLGQYNIYWQDEDIAQAYLDPGPANKQGTSSDREFVYTAMGAGKAYPAKQLMFCQMEGEVDPYTFT